jgi:5'-nucleotidase
MSRNRLIGSIGVAALVAGTLVVSPVAAQAADPQTIQVLGINDFHGRLVKSTTNGEAGAAVLSGAVNQLRTQYPDTVFAAAGDLIGASTFDSFIARDKPTIDALNEAGLDVSAVGNHEFDQGYADLVDRVMAPYDATTNPLGGAEWEYLGANVRNKDDNSAALPEAWIADFGEVQVGFVGAVTDHLPELVSPDGIEDLTIESPVVAANARPTS